MHILVIFFYGFLNLFNDVPAHVGKHLLTRLADYKCKTGPLGSSKPKKILSKVEVSPQSARFVEVGKTGPPPNPFNASLTHDRNAPS